MNITYVVIALVIVFFSIFCYFICKTEKENKELQEEIHKKDTNNIDDLKQYYRKETEQEQEKLNLKKENINNEIEAALKQRDIQLSNINNEIKKYESILGEKEKRYNEVNQDLDLYKQGKIKEIDSAAAEYEQRKRLEIKQTLEKSKLMINSDLNNYIDSCMVQKTQLQSELDTIKKELEEERTKRAAINEEILRQRALDEQQDFYRIQISEDDQKDIDILRDIVPRLRRPDAVSKIIWTNYYQKPLAELRKRLMPNGDIAGIYKLTRLKTGEIYIGKSTSIDKRWQEHVKTALGCGTLASTQLHTTMAKDGPEQFTFEILEETPKDKLFERESYYIDFYDSKMYGLNTVTGEKNK